MTLTNDLEQGHVLIGQHPCHGGHSGKPNVGFIFAALARSGVAVENYKDIPLQSPLLDS